MSEIIKIKDERERRKSKDRMEQRGDARYSEKMRDKWICCESSLSPNNM